ncbi:MAG: hypothetical protein Q4B48_02365 [Syntrophomonadaceae bacterium]|nr:hypothetical protein [Syntrophomonadaceae bacterium]
MRKILTLALVLILLTLSTVPASAAQPALNNAINGEVVYGQGETNPTRAEETMWYFRNNNGVLEKRLWSITYRYWKTDWMPA